MKSITILHKISLLSAFNSKYELYSYFLILHGDSFDPLILCRECCVFRIFSLTFNFRHTLSSTTVRSSSSFGISTGCQNPTQTRTTDEEEMVENLFDCLCCLLMPLENKERVVKAEGVELIRIIMKQKKLAYGSAIRALDFAMTNYPPACERFVDVLGLKTAFAAFMGKASATTFPTIVQSLIVAPFCFPGLGNVIS